MFTPPTPSLRPGGVVRYPGDGPAEFEAELVDCPGWNVVARIDTSTTPPTLVGVGVQPQAISAGPRREGVDLSPEFLTSAVLRSVRLRDVINGANTVLKLFKPGPLPQPGRQRPGSDRYYAAWAAQYVALAGSRRPIADLADKTGKTRDQVRDLIHLCRVKGMLTKGRPGSPGGELTELAREVLGVEDGDQ